MTERPFVPPWERRGRPLPEAKARVGQGDGVKRTPYRLGRDFERSIRGRLERRGYFVMRAYGSKGKADLLAVGPVCVEHRISALFIQCKRRGDIGSREWNEVWDLAQTFDGWAVVTMKLSERTVGFYRIDAPREPRKPGRPWTMFDPADLGELLPPPSLMDKAA